MKLIKYIFLIIISDLIICQNIKPQSWWTFDKVKKNITIDKVNKIEDNIFGNYRVVKGVYGEAIFFDGYTTVIKRKSNLVPNINDVFTIEAWIAVAAYPWNWVPIVDLNNGILYGFDFSLGPRGELRLSGAVDSRRHKLLVPAGTIPIKQWVHVAARFDANGKLEIFKDGVLVGVKNVIKPPLFSGRNPTNKVQIPKDVDLLIGGIRKPLRPSSWIRFKGNRPSWFSFDGIMDEVKIYNNLLSNSEILQNASVYSPGIPPIELRQLPSGPKGPGKFGAYLTKLNYYPEWDALWRVAEHPDILVRFDISPVRVIFWRGTQYSPVWVTENNLWMADQSVEGYNEDYTYEHMNDKNNLYSHVRIIEENDARVVVHWRYALVNVDNEFYNMDERLGNGAWVDEYYYFFPDAMGIRKITWPSETLGSPIQFQESIPFTQPGQLQGNVINEKYVTVGNMEGDTHNFFYVDDPKIIKRDLPKDLIIQMHNFKSEYKPFIVFEPGNSMSYLRDMDIRSLSRPGSVNHWPVGKIYSDGRITEAPDRTASFLGFPISKPKINNGSNGRDFIASLYGMTNKSFSELLSVARSWAQAPEMKITKGNYKNLGYDRSERAYKIKSLSTEKNVSMYFAATNSSPVNNLSIIILNGGHSNPNILIDGKEINNGASFRYGIRNTLVGADIILWLEIKREEPFNITLN
jgi:hypothetical protein|tara:strand:- start:1285 stop:3354 length:2070 start_codon:yes stop_codon:yes gene_type:complete